METSTHFDTDDTKEDQDGAPGQRTFISSISGGGFFDGRAPVLWILSSFFVFTIPLILLSIFANNWLSQTHLATVYFIIIGGSHFCLTFALYMQRQNLEHFGQNRLNQLIYFGVPTLIFASFALYRSFGAAALFPGLDFVFVSAVRFFNFHHWGRQSFGVLQLFKRRSATRYPSWMRICENCLFYALLLPMMLTYFNQGQFSYHDRGLAFIPAVLFFLAIAYGLLKVSIGDKRSVGDKVTPPGHAFRDAAIYFFLQTLCGALTIFRTSYYVFALAMHYVEYHVVMYPRCFHSKLGENGIDKVYSLLRSNKALFYIGLLNVAAISSAMIATSNVVMHGRSVFLLSLFDGLFVFHYFVESFVWRFNSPFYRQTVLPLYFAKSRGASEAATAQRAGKNG